GVASGPVPGSVSSSDGVGSGSVGDGSVGDGSGSVGDGSGSVGVGSGVGSGFFVLVGVGSGFLGVFVGFGFGSGVGFGVGRGSGPSRLSPLAIRAFSSQSVRRSTSTSTKAGSPISSFIVRSARRNAVDMRLTYSADPGVVRETSSA